MSQNLLMRSFPWTQVGGDMDPGSYGGTIARCDGNAIELINIQPVREYAGDAEALEVGFPFWSRKAYYDASDLDVSRDEVQQALKCCGLDLAEIGEEWQAIAIACALLDYGTGVDEGPAGWARDVIGDRRVRWMARDGRRATGWRYLADEDAEFRALQREAKQETKKEGIR